MLRLQRLTQHTLQPPHIRTLLDNHAAMKTCPKWSTTSQKQFSTSEWYNSALSHSDFMTLYSHGWAQSLLPFYFYILIACKSCISRLKQMFCPTFFGGKGGMRGIHEVYYVPDRGWIRIAICFSTCIFISSKLKRCDGI